MNDMVDKFIGEYEELIGEKVALVKTPGAPVKYIFNNDGDMIMLDEYHNMVVKALYYTTQISSECCNVVIELSQHM